MKVLIISPTPTHPTTAGNRARIFQLLEELDRIGQNWLFVFVRAEDGDEEAMLGHWGRERCVFIDRDYQQRRKSRTRRIIDKIRKRLGMPMMLWPNRVDDWCGDRLMADMDRIRKELNPDVVWIEYVFLSRLFELFDPETIRILDTHDVFANRHKMMLRQGIQPEWFFTTPKEEKIGCQRADVVVAIQDRERDYFERKYGVHARTIGHFTEIQSGGKPTAGSPVVAFIGSMNLVNVNALDWFVRKVWSQILSQVPEARLEVYGDSARTLPQGTFPQVDLIGRVECLDDAYKRSWLVIAPLRMGTGLKIKSMEALGKGKALVATPCGAEGMEDGVDSAFLSAESAQEFASACVRILKHPELRLSLENSAVEYARAWNKKNQDCLRGILNTPSGLDRGSPARQRF